MTTTVIKTFTCRHRNFTIVNQNGWYCAIEDKYITDGKINTALNGWQMFADRELSRCLDRAKDRVELDYLESTGMTKAEAFATYFGMMENLAMVEEMFSK